MDIPNKLFEYFGNEFMNEKLLPIDEQLIKRLTSDLDFNEFLLDICSHILKNTPKNLTKFEKQKEYYGECIINIKIIYFIHHTKS